MIELPDIKDVGIVAEFVMWGNPWHGTVKGGVLNTGKLDETASEITRAWPQPPNAFIWLSQKDGQPDAAYSATQAAMKAAHAAAGMEFKPWALISGGQVYGKQLGSSNRWFYYAGDQVWLVTLTYPGTVTNTGSITVQISAQAWPEFTTEPHSAPIVRSVTLADIGQAAPDLSSLGIASTLQLWLHDVKPNGSACILSLHTASTVDGVVPPALGFVLVELSSVDGVFDAVAASVLRTREQTLGSVTANRNYSEYVCSKNPVEGTTKCIPVSHTGIDGGVELVILARIVSAYFDEQSGAVLDARLDYSLLDHKQAPAVNIWTVTNIVGNLVYFSNFYTSQPSESNESLTYRVGASSHVITSNSSVFGAYSEAETSGTQTVSNLDECELTLCYDAPADTPYKTEAEILKMRLTANIVNFPCRYPNGYGPVVLLKDKLIGTPKGITAITEPWLNGFEVDLFYQQALLYVAYHPKTGEVVPFKLNPVSFV